MTTSLIDSLKSLATPDLMQRIASHLDEPAEHVASGMTGGMGAMLMGLLGKSGNPSAMQGIFSTVSNNANDGSVLENPASLIGAAPGSPMSSLGSQFLSSIFGGHAPAVNDALSRTSGLRGASVTSLMQMASPLLLGVLGKRVREGGLNAASLGRLISDERASIWRAAPPGIASALGMQERAPEQEVPVGESRYEQRSRSYPPQPERARNNRWVWPTVAVLAALALILGTRQRRHPPVVPINAPPTASGGEVAPVAPVVTPTPGGPIRLPNGTVINAPANAPEGMMVAFLSDSNQRVDTTWMVLNRLQFETNSANLRPESQAEVRDVAAVLKAYPNATVKIGGFTDSTGNEAANLKLSRDRAQGTRAAIIKMGIAPSRVTAEGFGSQHPIASNSTDEGRAQNRRIAVIITNK
jgi:outer membrane protein OmpA-like peptidoglycan-associated protein